MLNFMASPFVCLHCFSNTLKSSLTYIVGLIDIHQPRMLDWDLGSMETILRSSSDLESFLAFLAFQACGLIFMYR